MSSSKLEKVTLIEEKIKQLENRKKIILQQYKEEERKARTHRLCTRGGLLESIFPESLNLSDIQMKSFLEMTLLTDYSRNKYNDALRKKAVTDNELPKQRGHSSLPSNSNNPKTGNDSGVYGEHMKSTRSVG